MKGLLIHDFYRMKKAAFTNNWILIWTFAVCIIILLGVRYGNLAPLDEDGDLLRVMIAVFDSVIPLFAGLNFYTLIFAKFGEDLKGWNKYLFSLPVSDKKRVGSVYIVSTALSLVSLAVALCFSVTGHIIAGNLSGSVLVMPVMIYSLIIVFSYIMVSVLYIFKNIMKTVIFGIILYFALSFIFVILAGLGDPGELIIGAFINMSAFFTRYPWTIIVILGATAALSYIVSLTAINNRREKLCSG